MRLNPDCIRDILLACEEICTLDSWAHFDRREPFSVDGRTYQSEELFYHLNQCDLNGFFTECQRNLLGGYIVRDLTPIAHEFLANIRGDSIWIKTKEIANNANTTSLSALRDIAVQVVATVIAAQFSR